MKKRRLSTGLCVLCAVLSAHAVVAAQSATATAADHARAPEAPLVTVRMQTSLGTIALEIDSGHAPLTAANFLRYVDQKRFDNSTFYRAMKVGDSGELGLVQGGLRGNPKRALKPIAHEPTSVTGLSHASGAISMARAAPGTAGSDFFIVIGDLKTLDAHDADPAAGLAADPGYAVFGRVVEGMDVVRAVLEQPVSGSAPVEAMKGQMIEKPVAILSVRRQGAEAPAEPR
jgi:peptidyl-prolyl cis-trans isomerase A (cyclophilin A)